MCPPPKIVQTTLADTVRAMKPRIRKLQGSDAWECAGSGQWSVGATPADAYHYWRFRMRLAVQGRSWGA